MPADVLVVPRTGCPLVKGMCSISVHTYFICIGALEFEEKSLRTLLGTLSNL